MTATGTLDEAQRAAAHAPAGRSLVLAGAGTGKTTVLVERISHLVAALGVPGDAIVSVTFTNKAAREMRERVEAKAGHLAAGLRLGTFHSLSCRILRRHAALAGLRDGSFGIVDDEDARELMTRAAQVPGAWGPFVPPEGADEGTAAAARKDWSAGLRDFVKAALRQVSLWKSWGLTDAMAGDPDRARRSDEEEAFAAAYVAYQYELEAANLCDFGDLILKVVTLFDEHPDILRAETANVRHVLVDEGQDANQVQVRWVRHMASMHDGLTVVGDEDQNIYGFQGGYPGAMDDMAGPTARRFRLVANRRCTEEVLKPANLAVDYNRRKDPKELSSGRSGTDVVATSHATEAQEAAWIARHVSDLVDGGARPGDIAVLFRSAWTMAPVEEALARRGVPTAVVSGTSLLDREEVKDILCYVRLAVSPGDELAFRRIANRPVRGLGPVAVEAVCALAAARGLPFHEALHAAADAKGGGKLRKDAREGAAALGRALTVLAEDGRWGRCAYDTVGTAIRETGYAEWLKSQKEEPEERARNVAAVHRLSDDHEDAVSFLQEVALLTDLEPASMGGAGRVRMSTIHASKGLEFDHVVCPGFDDGIMPNGRALGEGKKGKVGDVWNGPQGGGMEEERRLAHVAFTRARHSLAVTFPWKRVAVKGRKGGKSGGPSSLVEECELAFVSGEGATSKEMGRRGSSRREGRQGYAR